MSKVLEKIKVFHLFGMSVLFMLAFGVSAYIFIIFPEIDLWFTSLFYDPVKKFYLKDFILFLFLYESVDVMTILFGTMLIVCWVIKKKPFNLTRKKIVYLLLLLGLGPGLVVNTVFKNHWGRARPEHVEQFGGTREFTPAFVISRQCDHNCSFVSGHASIGFYFLSIAFLFGRYRRLIFTLALTYGTLVGLTRIAQGRHFLSDVIFSFFIVYGIAKVFYYVFFERSLKVK